MSNTKKTDLLMDTYLWLRMPGCVKGEKIKFVFSGLEKMNLAILNEEQFKQYEENLKFVLRNRCKNNAIGTIQENGVWYAVFDDNGAELKNVTGAIYRYSPCLSNEEVSNDAVKVGESLVLNASDTDADGSMIQYWKEHQHQDSQINLDNKTFVCPSCGNRVNTEDLHGAHVVKLKGNDIGFVSA